MMCVAVQPAGQSGEEGKRVRGYLQQVGGAPGEGGDQPLGGEERRDEESA